MRFRERLLLIAFVIATIASCRPHSKEGVTTAVKTSESHILFTGIATIDNPGSGGVAQVEIPSVFKHAPAGQSGESIPDHVPFIVVDKDVLNVIAESGRCSDEGPNGHLRLCILDAADIHVEGLTSGPGAIAGEVEEKACSQTAANLYYVPHLTKVLPGICSPDVPRDVVTYAVHTGYVGAYILSKHIEVFIGIDKKVHQQQRIAQAVDWKFTRLADRLVLKNQKNKDVLVVEAKNPAVPIAIVAGSAPESEVKLVLNNMSSGSHSHDHHFDVYYDRCKNPADRPIPYDTTLTCPDDTSYVQFPWWPEWMKPKLVEMVGGFNCGPDQMP